MPKTKKKSAKSKRAKLPPVAFPKGAKVLVKLTSAYNKQVLICRTGVVTATRTSNLDRAKRVYTVAVSYGELAGTLEYTVLARRLGVTHLPMGGVYETSVYESSVEAFPESK